MCNIFIHFFLMKNVSLLVAYLLFLKYLAMHGKDENFHVSYFHICISLEMVNARVYFNGCFASKFSLIRLLQSECVYISVVDTERDLGNVNRKSTLENKEL